MTAKSEIAELITPAAATGFRVGSTAPERWRITARLSDEPTLNEPGSSTFHTAEAICFLRRVAAAKSYRLLTVQSKFRSIPADNRPAMLRAPKTISFGSKM